MDSRLHPSGFDALPHVFGRYVLERRLGGGGMGAVYLARDSTLDRHIALKIPLTGPNIDDRVAGRFLREAQTAACVDHPFVCPIFDHGIIDGQPYLTMAYVSGGSLVGLATRAYPLDQRQAAALVRRVALGVEAAHRQGVLHRDLKPANILLDAQGQPRVTDFGLALSLHQHRLTEPGQTPGTPAYMSPEQARGEALTAATDVYSLGVVLYELLTGRTPFAGPGPMELLYQHSHVPVPSPRVYRPDLDPQLEATCLKALAKCPSERHGSMAELAAELELYLRSTGCETATITLPTTPTPPAAASAPRRHEPEPSRRRSYVAMATLLAALAAVGGYIAIQHANWRGKSSPGAMQLKGSIDVRVWEKAGSARRDLSLNDPDATPLRVDDKIRVEAYLDHPAYMYIVWITADGQVAPVYPWKPGHWDIRPSREETVQKVSLPADLDAGWPIRPGPSGMETLLLLARLDPLPEAVDLRALLTGLPPTKLQNEHAVVWFENGEVLRTEAERGPDFFDTEEIDDPVLRTQRLLKEKLGPHFAYMRAVSFASRGK